MNNLDKIIVSLIEFPIFLAIVFIILKLCNVVAWSWWWILSPIWIPIIIILLGFIFLLILDFVFD
jgi:sterol desaturase/sphingolipid hydroxylase (fatty acid hydroxylase superfamily)